MFFWGKHLLKRHSLKLHWFADLMNVTEEVTIHRPNVSTLSAENFASAQVLLSFSTNTFSISWRCFLGWSSCLSSTSTRCFCSCNSPSFHFWTWSFFSRKYAIVSPPLLQLFLLWFHFLLLFIPLPFLSSSQVFYSLCFSFPLLFRFQLYDRFLRCLQLQLRLFIPEPFPTHSNDIHTCLHFVFHLCFKFSLSSMYLSLTAHLLT